MSGQESSHRGCGSSSYDFSQINAGHRLHAAANQRRVDNDAAFAAAFGHISVTDTAGEEPPPPPPPQLPSPAPPPLPPPQSAIAILPILAGPPHPSAATAIIAIAPPRLPAAAIHFANSQQEKPIAPAAAAAIATVQCHPSASSLLPAPIAGPARCPSSAAITTIAIAPPRLPAVAIPFAAAIQEQPIVPAAVAIATIQCHPAPPANNEANNDPPFPDENDDPSAANKNEDNNDPPLPNDFDDADDDVPAPANPANIKLFAAVALADEVPQAVAIADEVPPAVANLSLYEICDGIVSQGTLSSYIGDIMDFFMGPSESSRMVYSPWSPSVQLVQPNPCR